MPQKPTNPTTGLGVRRTGIRIHNTPTTGDITVTTTSREPTTLPPPLPGSQFFPPVNTLNTPTTETEESTPNITTPIK